MCTALRGRVVLAAVGATHARDVADALEAPVMDCRVANTITAQPADTDNNFRLDIGQEEVLLKRGCRKELEISFHVTIPTHPSVQLVSSPCIR